MAYLGAAEHYETAHFMTQEIQLAVQHAQFFYAEGFFITVSLPTLELMSQHAHQHGKVSRFS